MDKAAITPALVSRLVAEQFPHWAQLPGHVRWSSTAGTTRPSGSATSCRFACRAPTAYVAQVEKEQRWLPAPRAAASAPDPGTARARARPERVSRDRGRSTAGSTASPRRSSGSPTCDRFATDLADFLAALYADRANGRPGGRRAQLLPRRPARHVRRRDPRDHRGLDERIDVRAATEAWDEALGGDAGTAVPCGSTETSPASNLLVVDGRLQRRHRLRLLRGRRSRVRHRDGLDVLPRGEPARRSVSQLGLDEGDLGTWPRVGALEGAHHARPTTRRHRSREPSLRLAPRRAGRDRGDARLPVGQG